MNTQNEAKTQALITLDHLAGGENGAAKLSAMIAMKNLAYSTRENYVTFHFKGSRKANMIKIQISHLDLYDVTFYKFSKKNHDLKVVEETHGLYSDQLKEYFTSFTGLETSL